MEYIPIKVSSVSDFNYSHVDIEANGNPFLAITIWPTHTQILHLDAIRKDEKGNPIVISSKGVDINLASKKS